MGSVVTGTWESEKRGDCGRESLMRWRCVDGMANWA